MSARFFLDSNIFIYSFDVASPAKAQRSLELIREAATTRQGIVSFQVVQEFFHFALRRITPPMTVPDAREYLSTVFRPLLIAHSSEGLYAHALHLHGRFRLSWYDSLIVASAMDAECRILYSEDLQHGQTFGELKVRNPFL
jgi:predicted nucleic acid-binding protein